MSESAINLSAILPLLIPIIAIVMGIGLAIVAIVLDFRKKRALFELHHKERMLAIERGMEIPPLPADFYGSAGRHGSCRRGGRYSGIVLLFVGVAIWYALTRDGHENVAAWGFVVSAVGLGRLLRDYLHSRSDPASPPSPPSTGADPSAR